jgi:hypothetical protein
VRGAAGNADGARLEQRVAAVEQKMTAIGTKVDRMMAMLEQLTALGPAAPAEDGHNPNAAV